MCIGWYDIEATTEVDIAVGALRKVGFFKIDHTLFVPISSHSLFLKNVKLNFFQKISRDFSQTKSIFDKLQFDELLNSIARKFKSKLWLSQKRNTPIHN